MTNFYDIKAPRGALYSYIGPYIFGLVFKQTGDPISASHGGNNYEDRLLSDYGKTYTERGIGIGLGSPYGLMKNYNRTWLLR